MFFISRGILNREVDEMNQEIIGAVIRVRRKGMLKTKHPFPLLF